MAATGQSVVSIQGVTKSFRTGVTALEDIELDIRPGEFVSLIGPSGCGKSTLLRVIGDLIQPTSGSVLVNGKSAHRARLDHDYGIVFQDAVLYDWRTVSRNVSLPLELLRIWEKAGSTVVFVTHSIPEAVFLSTRVVVMSARPGRVAEVIDVDLPQPRGVATREEPRFFELVTEVRERLAAGGADLVAEEPEVAEEAL